MKLQVKKSISLVLCFTILLSAAIVFIFTNKNTAAYAEDELASVTIQQMSAYSTVDENNRFYTLVESHVTNNMGENLSIDCVKNLLDFNGNKYTLFELDPTGYVIFHNDSGKFVEYSELSTSPYLSFESELFYGGMGQFYYKIDNIFYHTEIADRVISASDISVLAENSQLLADKFINDIYDTNLAFIKGETVGYSVATVSSETAQTRVACPAPRISRDAFFSKLTTENTFGYVGGGACGYIAANMLIAYNYFAFDYGLTSNGDIYNLVTKTINGSALTEFFMLAKGLDPYDEDTVHPGTIASDHPSAMNDYISITPHNLSWNASSTLLEFGVVSSIDRGYPVALFGNYPNPIDGAYGNHAVVAYEYQRYGFLNLGLRYRVHYGWDNWASTWLEATGTGSSLFLEAV